MVPSTLTRIDRRDVKAMLRAYAGHDFLALALERSPGQKVLRLLAQYVGFNSLFAAGISWLVGAIGYRHDLFQDRADPIAALRDRGAVVAKGIFAAAVDEYMDEKTHRTMAQDTLRAIARFYPQPAENMQLSAATNAAIDNVARGYRLNQIPTESEICMSLGFHLASEVAGDEEFNLIYGFLQRKHAKLLRYLETEKKDAWIKVHTIVEVTHLTAATNACNLALKYYTGDPGQAKRWIMDGVVEFANVQSKFMESLSDVSK